MRTTPLKNNRNSGFQITASCAHLGNAGLVLDRHGCDLEDEDEVRRMAARTAIELMQRLPRYNGWTSWLVNVHDEDGFLIDTVLFTDYRAERANVRVQREPAISRSRTELCTAFS